MATSEQLHNCEACIDGGVANEIKLATVYCVECQQKLCQSCEEDHKKFKVTRRHKTMELNSESLCRELPLNTCDKHVDKYLEIYCFDCEMAICMMCCISSHNKHIMLQSILFFLLMSIRLVLLS